MPTIQEIGRAEADRIRAARRPPSRPPAESSPDCRPPSRPSGGTSDCCPRHRRRPAP